MSLATYDHTQIASRGLIVLVVVLFAAIVIPTFFFASLPLAISLGLLVPMAISALAVLIFSRLRIVVRDGVIRWSFGYGFPAFSLPVSEVTSAQPVRNPWYYGLGIHFMGRGMIYNVWGWAAVELIRVNGKRIRLGTDEPEALAAAILRAR